MSGFSTYFRFIASGFATAWQGLGLTVAHLGRARRHRDRQDVQSPGYFGAGQQGIVTLRYPHERATVPPLGRYKLENEIDDCIVCDKCARVCPVDCIEIEPIRAVEEFGKTSDGTPKKIYAAKFDIDMAKCCFCGLCTTVCPTECLTMSPEYDYTQDVMKKLTFGFATLSPTEADGLRADWELAQADKAAAVARRKAEAAAPTSESPPTVLPSDTTTQKTALGPRPPFRPVIKKPAPPTADNPPIKPDEKPTLE